MTRSALRWFTLRETVIGIAISTLVSTVPAVVLRGALQAEAAQAVRTVAVVTPFAIGLFARGMTQE